MRLNLAKRPSDDALAIAGLEEKQTDDDRWGWAAAVKLEDALGARLLLEVACGLI